MTGCIFVRSTCQVGNDNRILASTLRLPVKARVSGMDIISGGLCFAKPCNYHMLIPTYSDNLRQQGFTARAHLQHLLRKNIQLSAGSIGLP